MHAWIGVCVPFAVTTKGALYTVCFDNVYATLLVGRRWTVL